MSRCWFPPPPPKPKDIISQIFFDMIKQNRYLTHNNMLKWDDLVFTLLREARNFTVKSTGSWDARECTVILQRFLTEVCIYTVKRLLFKHSLLHRNWQLQWQSTYCKRLWSNTCQITDFFLNFKYSPFYRNLQLHAEYLLHVKHMSNNWFLFNTAVHYT
jgi:hypothetical protein